MWADREFFNCDVCAGDPEAREMLGCEAAPKFSGDGVWRLPLSGAEVKVEVDRCPLSIITPDVLSLFSDGQTTEWRATYSELDRMPNPYREAMILASTEQALMVSEKDKMKRKTHG